METVNNPGKIVALKKQLATLRERKKGKITPEESQLISDRIAEIKQEIDDMSRPPIKVVPVVNAKTIAEREAPKRASSVKANRTVTRVTV